MGQLDNTLIIYICGRQRHSPEGTLSGTPNQSPRTTASWNSPSRSSSSSTTPGPAGSYPHMAVAWSWAFDTPFKWTKQLASHSRHTAGPGDLVAEPHQGRRRHAPPVPPHHRHRATILESTGVKAPQMVDGIKQKPIEGVAWPIPSTRPRECAFDAQDPVLRDDRQPRIYNDGWYANTTPPHGAVI